MRKRRFEETRRCVGAVFFGLFAMVLAFALSGCAHRNTARVPAGRVPRAQRPSVPPTSGETGLASWYGHPYHGRRAADGEIYDMETMVAAHRTLPFGTWVRVVNLDNGETVDVRIIDRGPFVEGRIIDLSHAAAQKIDLIGPGIAKVRLDIVSAPEAPATAPVLYAVQVGAFSDRARAEQVRADMERQYGTAQLVPRQSNPTLWRVLVGREITEDAVLRLERQLGGEAEHCFVVRLDNLTERAEP